MDAWGRVSVWAGVDTSGETSVDGELCTCRETTAEVCVVDAGGTVLVAAVVAATDTGVAVLVDTWVGVTFVVATVMDFSGDDVVVVTVGNGAGAAPVEVTGGGIFTVFSAVVAGVVICSLEGAVATGVVTWTPSVGGDEVTVTVFALAVTLVDVVVGEGMQIGVGAAGVSAEDVPATETVVPCVAT